MTMSEIIFGAGCRRATSMWWSGWWRPAPTSTSAAWTARRRCAPRRSSATRTSSASCCAATTLTSPTATPTVAPPSTCWPSRTVSPRSRSSSRCVPAYLVFFTEFFGFSLISRKYRVVLWFLLYNLLKLCARKLASFSFHFLLNIHPRNTSLMSFYLVLPSFFLSFQ